MKHHPALKRAIVCTVTHIHDTMSAERRLNRILGHLDASQCRSTQNPVAAESSLRIAAPSTPKPVSLDAWKANVGKEIGVSSWLHLTQERVDAFALATGDHQWIHTKDAGKKGSPFGGPIAHGFLALSLAAFFAQEILPNLEGAKMGVNFGVEKLRFVSPVPVGKNVRMRATLVEAQPLDGAMKGVQNTVRCTIEVENSKKPSLVFDWLTRTYF